MQTLQLGSSGLQVVQLQQKLKQIGAASDPGPIDGMFGQTTHWLIALWEHLASCSAYKISHLKLSYLLAKYGQNCLR